MKVLITGGTGFLGGAIRAALMERGHEIILMTRAERPGLAGRKGLHLLVSDPAVPGPWMNQVAQAEAIVNLAGASIFSRWTKAQKRRIMESRVNTTRNLAQAVAACAGGPRVFISASAVGYYGYHGAEELTEADRGGQDFLARVCQAWETEALAAQKAGARVALTRFGVVLGRGQGALGQLEPLFRWGLGGRLGHGNQYFSWIHLADLVAGVLFCLENEAASGPLNLTSPYPVTNQKLTQALGRALKRPAFWRVPAFALRLALGQGAEFLVNGQRVMPARLKELGFQHRFPRLDGALGDILG